MGESCPNLETPPTKLTSKQKAQLEAKDNRALMREIYGEDKHEGYNPLPASQHAWHMDPRNPPLQRLWGWMIESTVNLGHRTAYATVKRQWHEKTQTYREGRAKHVEDFAEECKDYGKPMEISNAYRTVRKAIQRGWLRYGTPEEGERRLYLTGRVPKFGAPDRINCTDHFPESIQRQMTEWSTEDSLKLRQQWEEETKLEGQWQAAVIAANRAAFARRKDALLQSKGLKPIHQEHTKKGENPEQAEARRQNIRPISEAINTLIERRKEGEQILSVQTTLLSDELRLEPPRRTITTLLPIQSNYRESSGVAQEQTENEPPPPPLSLPPEKTEEEEPPTIAALKALYPPARFDAGKTKTVWGKLSDAERRTVISRLQVYLNCDRWKDQSGQFIPLCSKWLDSYEADPPPKLQLQSSADRKQQETRNKVERVAAVAKFLRRGVG